jgi:ssDNA-specific exonuclease RecJ
LPSREDFVAVYKFVVTANRNGVDTFTHRELTSRLAGGPDGINVGYVKLKIIIKVLQELNLVGIDEIEDETYKFSVRYSQKTNLEKSNIYKKLKADFGQRI